MSSVDATTVAQSGIEQMVGNINAQLLQLQDVEKQLSDLSTVVNNFVLQTLQFVSDNEDVPVVNEQLVSSLVQIKNFVARRPNEISVTKLKLEQRKDAFEQCMLIMNEAIKSCEEAITKQDNDQAEEPDQELAIENLPDDVEHQIDEEKKRRILDKIDSDGKYDSRRPVGHRPEKIRDIRHVEDELRSQKNPEEDI